MVKNSPAGIYIHIPFCRSKCPYCDFYSHTDQSLIPHWLAAVKKEIEIYKNQFPVFDTVYLGGGTPSILSALQLGRLFEFIRQGFNLDSEAEITIEANPGDLNPDLLKRYLDLGINRIGLGVQSFDDQALKFLSRSHTAKEAEKTLEWIRKAGFLNLSIDLIYALPEQTRDQWLGVLKKALAFHPQHLSCYQLTIAKGTLFFGRKAKGQLNSVSEKEEEAFFLITSRYLEARGFIHYEVSNFARGKKYFSRHNQKYWHRDPYLGLGPSAHSFFNDRRWWNIPSVGRYIRALEEGQTPVAGEEDLDLEQTWLEWVSLGLRTKAGLDLNRLGERVNLESTLPKMIENGWAEVIGNRLVPTRKGFLVADRLPLLME